MERCLNGTGEPKIVAAILDSAGTVAHLAASGGIASQGAAPCASAGRFAAGCLVGGSAVRAAATQRVLGHA